MDILTKETYLCPILDTQVLDGDVSNSPLHEFTTCPKMQHVSNIVWEYCKWCFLSFHGAHCRRRHVVRQIGGLLEQWREKNWNTEEWNPHYIGKLRVRDSLVCQILTAQKTNIRSGYLSSVRFLHVIYLTLPKPSENQMFALVYLVY